MACGKLVGELVAWVTTAVTGVAWGDDAMADAETGSLRMVLLADEPEAIDSCSTSDPIEFARRILPCNCVDERIRFDPIGTFSLWRKSRTVPPSDVPPTVLD